MKPLFMFFFHLSLSLGLFAQETEHPQLEKVLDGIRNITGKTDSLVEHSKKQFGVSEKIDAGKSLRETWQYLYNKEHQFIFFRVSHHKDSAYFEEDYYITNNYLILSVEKHIGYMPHYFGNQESSHWIEECYFIKNRMIHEISHGHGITELDGYDPKKK